MRSPFRLHGKSSRRELLFVVLILGLAIAGTAWLGASPDWWQMQRYGFALIGLAAMAVLVTLVRRLRDIGHAGVWGLLWLVPVVGAGLVLWLLFAPPKGHKRPDSDLDALLCMAGFAMIGALALLRLFFQPYWIPAESMKPTLLVGDYFLARYIGDEDVVRGDVIVFRHPLKHEDMVKRVIGLPGDMVQMTDGVVYLNGQPVPQEPAGSFDEVMGPQGPMASRPRCANAPVGEGAICRKSRLTETLPDGRRHDILNIDAQGAGDNTGMFTVPAGQYFVMGDNRDNSADSRFDPSAGGVGLVPADNLIGRVDRVLFSSAGSWLIAFWTWRSDRFFKTVE